MERNPLRQLDGLYRQTTRLVIRTWQNSPWRRRVLLATILISLVSLVGANFLASQSAQAAIANGGIFIYGDSADNGNVNFRAFTDPTTVGGELTTVATDTTNDIATVRVAVAPTREEIAVAHIKDTGRLDIATCTSACDAAGDWTLRATYSTAVTDANSELTRPYDIAYEQLSGNLVVFFTDDNTTGTIYYCEWNGTSWSPSTECNGGTFAPGAGNDITTSSVSVNGQIEWIRAEARGSRLTTGRSDEMLLAASDSADDLWLAHWTGTTADQAVNVTNGGSAPNQLTATSAQKFDIAWEETTGEGIAVLTDTADAAMRYVTFTSGAWDALSTDGPTNPAATAWNSWLELATDPISDDIALIGALTTPDADAAVWTGAGWTNSNQNLTDQEDVIGKNVAVEFERFSGRAIFYNVGLNDQNVDRHCWTDAGGFTTLDTSFISTTMNADDIEDLNVAGSPNSNKMLGSSADIDDTLEGWVYSGATGCADGDFANTSVAQIHGIGIEGHTGNTAQLVHQPAFKPYSPWSRNWRFYDDETVNDPTTGLNGAAENATPTGVDPEEFIRLRMNVKEAGNMAQTDTRKKLQYTSGCTPDSAGGEAGCTWNDVGDTGETSAVWRYATAGETCAACTDGGTSTTARLTGTNQTSPPVKYISDKDAAADADFDHGALLSVEYDFPLKAEAVEGATTYYFRLYEPRISNNGQDSAIFREQDDDGANDCASAVCTYPSLTTAFTISGTCDAYDQTTDCTDVGTIKVAVNGSVQAQEQTTIAGTWAITGVTITTGQILTVWIDGAASMADRAGAVVKYDGTGDITGIKLYKEHLTIGNADTQTLTNADISQYDNSVASGDDDVFWEVSAGNDLTVDTEAQSSQEELYIDGGATYQPASGGGGDVSTHDIEIDGSFTPDSNAITINGSWDNDGDYNAGTETITFTSTGSETINSTGATDSDINNVIFNGSGGAWTLTTALVANGDMTSTAGTVSGTQSLTIGGGDLICGGSCGTINLTGGTATLNGTGNFGTTALASNWTFATLTFGGTATAQGTGTITVSAVMNVGGTLNAGSKTYDLTGSGTPLAVSGTFTPQSSTISYEGTSATEVLSTTYNDIQFDPASGTPTYTLSGGDAVPSATQIYTADATEVTLDYSTRQVVRTSTGTLYAWLNDDGSCEVWKSADGSSWTEQDTGNRKTCTVGTASTAMIGMAIDSSDNLHLAYRTDTPEMLYVKFTTSSDTYGSVEAVSTNQTFQFDIAVDSNDVPHIVYRNETATDEMYDNRIGGSWNSSDVTVDTNMYVHISLAIDEDNVPVLVGSPSSHAIVASTGNQNDATSFSNHTVDAAGAFNAHEKGISIGVDPSGNTWVAFADADLSITLVERTDGSETSSWSSNWQSPTTDTDGGKPSLSISGSTIYVFYENTSNDIAYNSYSGSWSGETVLETGTFEDVKVRNSYWHFANDEVLDYLFTDDSEVYWHALDLQSSSFVANNFTLVNSGGTATVDADANNPTVDIDGDFTVNKGTFTAPGSESFTIAGDISTCTSCTYNHSNGTLTIDSTSASSTLNSGCADTDTCTSQDFYNLIINNSDADEADDNVTLTSNGIRVANTLTITNGELVQGTLNVRAEGTSAVSIAAAGEWNNISTGDLKLGGTFVNAGAAIFNSNNGTQCVEAADDIVINSTSGGSQRAWSGGGTFTLRNLNVTDMTDSSITVYTSALSNTTWTEASCGTIVSGGCFTNEGEGTPCTDDGGNAIKIAVNGVVDPGSDTVVDGSWSVTAAILSTNDILVIFIDGEATESEEATTIVKYDGTGNITNVKLYQSQLVIGTDSGSTNSDQTITAANLDPAGTGYENADDEDVLYDYTAGADITVDAEANKTEQLYIINGDTYRPASGGGSDTTTHNLEIDTSATITADSNTFTIGGSWNNGGTFTAGTGTVAFNTTVTGNTLSGTLNGASGFNDVTFTTSDATATDDWEIQATMAVANDFTLSAGNIDSNNNNLDVVRDFILTNAANTDYAGGSSTITIDRHFTDTGNKFTHDTSTVSMEGTGTVTGGSGRIFHNLNTGFTGFTTTLSNTNYTIDNQISFNGGTVTSVGSWMDLRCFVSSCTRAVFNAATTLSGTRGLYYNANASTTTQNVAGGNYGTWSVNMFTVCGCYTDSTYTLAGNVSGTSSFNLEATTSSTNNIFNTANFSISNTAFTVGNSGAGRVAPWTANFGSSAVTLTSTGDSFGVNSNGGAHTFNLSTSSISTAGSIRFVNGTGTVAASGTTSTITMTPAAAATRTFTTNAQTIDNFVVNGGAGSTVQLDGNLIASDNLTITAGAFDVTITSYSVTIGGNYSNSGTFTARTGTVTFNATDVGNTMAGTMTSTSAFSTLVFDGSGGEWTPSSAVAVSSVLTMTAGTLLGTQDITVGGNVQGTAGAISLSGGTFLHQSGSSKNFGTTSGSTAWSFNNLSFSNSSISGITYTTQTGGNGGITVAGILRIGVSGDGGTVTLDAGNRTWTLSGTGGDPFQILASPAGNLTPNTSTFSYTGNNGGGDTTIQTETYNVLQVNNGSEIYNLEGATIASDVTVSAGTLALNGQTLNVTDDLTVDGTLSGSTDVTVNSSVAGTGAITLSGGTFNQRVDADENFGTTSGSTAWTFNNLRFTSSSVIDNFRTITTQGGTGGIGVTGVLTIGDAADTTSAALNAGSRVWTLSGTGGNPFQLILSGALSDDLVPATSTFVYTGNNGSGDTTVQSETYNVLQVNNGSEIYNLEGATIGLDVTITAGTLALNGQTLQATNDLTVNGTLSGSTNVTVNGSVTGSGTVTLSGGTFLQRITANANETFGSTSGSNNWTFSTIFFRNSDSGNSHSITFNSTGSGQVIVSTSLVIGSAIDVSTLTLDNDTNDRIIDVNGSVSIASTAIFEPSSSASFTIADDWTNSGTFNHNNGTVTFDTTTTATIAGTTTFYGFTSTTAAKTLQFTAGQTFTIDTGGLLTLTGAADPNEIQIQSTTASQWFINHQGTESVSFAQVINSGCDGASTNISTTDSVDDGNNGACWQFGSDFSQEDFRFGQPNGLDIDYTGAPAENVAYTTSGTSDDFRLRMLIHVSGSNLAQNGNDFKLQFGEKTAATCASGVSWGDVATGSGVIRYFDGGGRADGDNLTTNGGDPAHGAHVTVAQDYEEANNFTNSVTAINSGQDGLWDFSLVNNSAVGGKRYCFKIVDVTGAADLTAYNQYPEVIVDEELVFTLDATSKNFGIIQPGGNPTDVSSTLTTTTNSSTGYVVYAWSTQLMTMGAFTLPDWTGTNSNPTVFGNGSFGFGYTTDDVTLSGGTADRFNPGGGGVEYAGFVHSGPGDPVSDRTSGPTSGQVDTIGYRIAASGVQEAGPYSTIIVYVCSVTF